MQKVVVWSNARKEIYSTLMVMDCCHVQKKIMCKEKRNGSTLLFCSLQNAKELTSVNELDGGRISPTEIAEFVTDKHTCCS